MKKYIDAEGVMRACFDSYAKTGNSAYKEIFELVSQMGEDVDEETRGILYANGHPICAIVNGKLVEVQEVKHGLWETIDKGHFFYDWKCSKCGGSGRADYLFCPNCGSRMDERSIDDEVADLPMEAYYDKNWKSGEEEDE